MVENVSSLPISNKMYFKNNTTTSPSAQKIAGGSVDTFEGRTAGKKKMMFGNSWDDNSGFKKLKDKFSDSDIIALNAKKELPQGYYLKAMKRNWNFPIFAKVEDGKMPGRLKLVKLSDEKVKQIKDNGKFISNKMPEGYKLVNDKKGNTYLLSEKHENFESTRKWLKKDLALCAAFVVASFAATIGACKLIDKFYPTKL